MSNRRTNQIPNLPKQEDPTDGYRIIYDWIVTNLSPEIVTGNETTSEIVLECLQEWIWESDPERGDKK